MNTNTEHLHEDQENSQLHKSFWRLFFRRNCCFSLHLTATSNFWSSLPQPTAKVLVPILITNYNTAKKSPCLAKNTVPETKRTSTLKIKHKPQPQVLRDAHFQREQRQRSAIPQDLLFQVTSVLSLPFKWLDELYLKSWEGRLPSWKKKKKKRKKRKEKKTEGTLRVYFQKIQTKK